MTTHKYYCNVCSRHHRLSVDFDERLEQKCPRCSTNMKYVGGYGLQDLRGGNNTHMPNEKLSETHIKLVGEEAHKRMFHDDPIFGQKSEVNDILNEYNAEQTRKTE